MLSIISITAIIYSCEEIKDAIDDYGSDDSCPERIFADTLDNQIIIKFEELEDENAQSKYFELIRQELRVASYTIERCDCDPKLVLMKFPPESSIDMEAIRPTIRSKLEDEGRGTYNFAFQLDITNTTYTRTYKKYQEISNSKPIIAVIDGGIMPDKFPPVLNIDELSKDFTGESTSTNPLDISTHGTIVTQILMDGIDPSKVFIMDLRIFKKSGEGSLFNGLCALSYAINNDVDIINMSWGGYFMDVDTTFLEYMRLARNNDITVVTSAGNDTIDTDHCLHFPSGFNSHVFASLGNVLGVASLNDTEDTFAYYSNYGVTTVGIAARQGSIETDIYKGTSFSAPIVTNHVVKMKLNSPSMPNVDIVNCITSSAIPITDLKVISGGKLNDTILVCP